jgi:hypothetical protein
MKYCTSCRVHYGDEHVLCPLHHTLLLLFVDEEELFQGLEETTPVFCPLPDTSPHERQEDSVPESPPSLPRTSYWALPTPLHHLPWVIGVGVVIGIAIGILVLLE